MSLLLKNSLWMNVQKRARLQEEVATWLEGRADDYTHAVTTTFEDEPSNIDEAETVFARFQNYLNKECFRRPKSADDKVKMAVVLEGVRTNRRLHYHCAMRAPDKLSPQEFGRRIKKAWRKAVRSGEARVDVQAYRKGWLPYMTKELVFTNTDGISKHNNF